MLRHVPRAENEAQRKAEDEKLVREMVAGGLDLRRLRRLLGPLSRADSVSHVNDLSGTFTLEGAACGLGQSATVFPARQREDGRRVALKVFELEALAQPGMIGMVSCRPAPHARGPPLTPICPSDHPA